MSNLFNPFAIFSLIMGALFMWIWSKEKKMEAKVEKAKALFAQEVSEPMTVDYKGAVVTLYPDGTFLVEGENEGHCAAIKQEIEASFKRRYVDSQEP
jgi:hypothetical protein